MTAILILRPEPGAGETLVRARQMGFDAVSAPIFFVRPIDWDPPAPDAVETVMLTSANAARHGGDALASYTALPCHAVGETTAEAARAAGFTDIHIGPADGKAMVAAMVEAGVASALHLCGREHIPLADPRLSITRRIVYASEPIAPLPAEAAEAIQKGALVLLHSPRMAAHFAALADEAGLDRGAIELAAISPAAVDAAGPGWKNAAAATAPRDAALLELAAKLCQIDGTAAGRDDADGL